MAVEEPAAGIAEDNVAMGADNHRLHYKRVERKWTLKDSSLLVNLNSIYPKWTVSHIVIVSSVISTIPPNSHE